MQKQIESSRKNIYQLANQLHNNKRDDSYEEEVQKIITAYCKVQQIKRPINRKIESEKKNSDKNQGCKPKALPIVTSQYSKKVKETLKQININRNKERNLIRARCQNIESTKQIGVSKEQAQILEKQNNLKTNSANKIWNVIMDLTKRAQRYTFTHLRKMVIQQNQYYENLIAYWKLTRVFNAWRNQSIFMKIQRQRINKEQRERQKRNNEIALTFRQFLIMKKHFQGWKRFNGKIRRQRIQRQQNRQKQIKEILKQDQNSVDRLDDDRPRSVKHNQNLQNKLRGFLDGLKNKVEDKRLKTIKENTEESQVRRSQLQQQFAQVDQAEMQNEHDVSEEVQNITENQQNADENQLPFSKKPLSNQELEQRRRQLAGRAKARKQTLQRKRKEKQAEKQRIQNERKQIQKQIQLQQKKLKQQQYKQFIRKKNEQQQWDKKQKQLIQRADEFSRLRIMKYYGFDQWKELKKQNKSRYRNFARILVRSVLKINFEQVCQRLVERAQLNLSKAYRKMDLFYAKKLKKKVINRLSVNRDSQLQHKQELTIRHQVHTLRVYFKEWFRVQPTLRLQNVEYYRLRIKRADQLRNLSLLFKSLRALKENKDDEQRNKNINDHKNRIKDKVKQWIHEVQVDIDQYL